LVLYKQGKVHQRFVNREKLQSVDVELPLVLGPSSRNALREVEVTPQPDSEASVVRVTEGGEGEKGTPLLRKERSLQNSQTGLSRS
jgi:hypothetical protein